MAIITDENAPGGAADIIEWEALRLPDVDYEAHLKPKPRVCVRCAVFGHTARKCPNVFLPCNDPPEQRAVVSDHGQ